MLNALAKDFQTHSFDLRHLIRLIVNSSTYQGYAWYHSLQLRASRRFSGGMSLNGSYTWAKNMLANGFLNPADPLPYRSISSADRPHRVTLALLYELPFGRCGKFLRSAPRLVNAAIGGWHPLDD